MWEIDLVVWLLYTNGLARMRPEILSQLKDTTCQKISLINVISFQKEETFLLFLAFLDQDSLLVHISHELLLVVYHLV